MYFTNLAQVPRHRYGIVYADPAWTYRDKANAGERGAIHKYPVMDDEVVRALPVASLAADSCACFLWVTYPKLPEGLATLAAWGFTYKTAAFTWVKRTKDRKVIGWAWGMGNWTRANAEVVLLGVRGRPQRQSASVHSIVDTPRGAHSAKPAAVRERIVRLLGEDVPRIELFARGDARDGWDRWGNDPTGGR